MPHFTTFDGIRIAYTDDGTGAAVVLLHGFAADGPTNWGGPGVIKALLAAGRRVIVPDARGHGASDKPHDPAAYGGDSMVRDAQGLFDHLALEELDLAGYSMGAYIAARLLVAEPRIRAAVLGGVGDGVARKRPLGLSLSIADALEAEDPAAVTDKVGRAFRRFADSTGADRLALAAIQRGQLFSSEVDLGAIDVPTLVICGDADSLVGSPQGLAEQIRGAELRIIKGDHLGAVMDPAFASEITRFFER